MNRREAMSALWLAAATAIGTAKAAGADPDTDSVILNGVSGLQIIPNSEDDFSLKVISGDGTKNVTLIRYKGPTAEADVQTVHGILFGLFRVLGLDV